MKKILSAAMLLCSFIFSCNSIKDTKECRNFKTGTFKYKEKQWCNTKIIRTENKQIEYDNATGLKLEYDIAWTSDCRYVLTQLKSNDSKINERNSEKIFVEIISIKDNSYKFSAKSNRGYIKGNIIRLYN